MNDAKNFQPPTPQEIAEHAYYLWESAGGVHGSDVDYWLQAEAHLLKNRQQDAGLLKEPAPTAQSENSQSEKAPASSTAPGTVGKSSKQRQGAGGGQRGYAGSRF